MDDNGLRTGAAECTVCRKNTAVHRGNGGAQGPFYAALRGFTCVQRGRVTPICHFRRRISRKIPLSPSCFVFAPGNKVAIRASIPSIEGTGGKGVGTMTKIPADSVVTPTELLMESFSPHSLDVKHPFDEQNSLETQPTGRTWQMFLRRGDNMAARLGKTVPFFLLLLPPYDRSILPPPCPRPLSTRFFHLLPLSRLVTRV